MRLYVRAIWESRHFWLHLSRSELRARFRRSRLGILWALLQPLLLTLLIAFVVGSIFGSPLVDFVPFVFSGILVWDLLTRAIIVGCSSIIDSEAYIKQKTLPIVIYPLKAVLTNYVQFLIAFVGLVLWLAFTKPGTLGLSSFSLLLSFPMLFAIAWPLAIVSAFVNTKFRDFHLFIGLVLQAVYFMSPVFFRPEMFRKAGIGYVLDYNPIAHILNLLRAPLLSNQFPTLHNYIYALGFGLVVWLVAIYKIRREELNLVFYL